MGQVSDYINGPYQGVSQVPMQMRLPGACREMVNAQALVTQGWRKRPPFEWVGGLVLGEEVDTRAVIHRVPQGSTAEDLLLVINWTGSSNKAYLFQAATRAAVPLTVSPEAQTYMDASGAIAAEDLKVSTIEDTSFILNTKRKVETSGDTSPGRPYEALIWVKTSGYARRTSVTVSPSGGTPVSIAFATSTGGTASDADAIGTDRQARALYDGTSPGGNSSITGTPLNTLSSQGFTTQRLGSVIYLSHPTDDFTVAISDDQGGTAVVGIKERVQRFSDLPSLAVDGFTVRIAQSSAGGNSDYYVQFDANATTSTGTWTEVVAPGAPLGLDPESMPVGLVLDGTWQIKVLDWGVRTTGDADLSPDPTFINDYISQVTWFRNRLTIIAQLSHEVLSASDSPFKFYTTTLATSLDSDSFGFLNPVERKAYFKGAYAFDERLVVFADGVQSITAAGDTVTATTTKATTLAFAPYTDQVPIQSVFNKLYFAAEKASGLSIMELAVDRVSGIINPDDVTQQLTTYLPSTIDRAISKDIDYWTLYGSHGSGVLYQHAIKHNNNERVQNAWWSWTLPDGFGLLGWWLDNGILNVVTKQGTSPVILRVDTTETRQVGYLHLDLLETHDTGSYSAIAGTTSFTLNQPLTANTVAVVTSPVPSEGYPEGYLPEVVEVGIGTVILAGDWSDYTIAFGRTYASYFIPNTWDVRDSQGNPRLNGRCTIQRLKVDLAKVGYLRVEVSSPGRNLRAVVYDGYKTDDADTPMDAPPGEETYSLKVPVGANRDKVQVKFINDSHLGVYLIGYEWVGDWTSFSREI